MLEDIGKQIRAARKRKGLSLEQLSITLNVSRGYLSNLETGKTDNIQLSILEKLQQELNLFASPLTELEINTDFELRLSHIINLLKEINFQDPKETEFLFSMIEKRYELSIQKLKNMSGKIQYNHKP